MASLYPSAIDLAGSALFTRASRVRPSSPPQSPRGAPCGLSALHRPNSDHEQKSVAKLFNIDICSVYYSVSEPTSPPSKDLYVVDFIRHPGDLGVSVIVRASGGISAQLEAFRLFPEFKRLSCHSFPHLLDYAEIDWQSGRCVVKKRKRQPVPIFTVGEPTKRRRSAEREDGVQ